LAFLSASAHAYDRKVTIINESGRQVNGVYTTNVDTTNWGPNILRGYVLDDEQFTFNFDDGQGYCRFDVKVTWRDGGVGVKNGFNVCEESELIIR
jgi:hypothetical protein